MAGAIRLTKAEREFIREAIATHTSPWGTASPKAQKLAGSINAKLDKSEAPKGTGVDVKVAVAAFQGVLGTRLIMPMGSVWGIMQNRIRALGLTTADCTKIAEAAKGEWRGPVKAESLVRQAEKLLHGNPAGDWSTPSGKRGALDIGDEL